jgi:GNAT superfamily N-acetyltransferase
VTAPVIRILTANEAAARLNALSAVLIDSVEGGASVGFLAPMTRAKADAFWQGVIAGIAAGGRRLLVAEDSAGALLGTVQLVFAAAENQPHRADLSKLLVLQSARRNGIGVALMRAAEAEARASGRTVLVLDTATTEAERVYQRTGWTRLGALPDYALMPDGSLCDTVFYYKRLRD